MTQRRKTHCPKCGHDLEPISNYFDRVEAGVGKRGSTFTDIDGVSHDLETKRFLFREFKQPHEPLDKAQRWTLTDLATKPGCTVWFVRRLGNGLIGWAQVGSGKFEIAITEREYRRLLECWWHERQTDPTPAAPAASEGVKFEPQAPLKLEAWDGLVDEIRWS